MFAKSACGVALCLIGSMSLGCSQNSQVVRAQNPAFAPQQQQGAVQQAGHVRIPSHAEIARHLDIRQHAHDHWKYYHGQTVRGHIAWGATHGAAGGCADCAQGGPCGHTQGTLFCESPLAHHQPHHPHHLWYEYTPPMGPRGTAGTNGPNDTGLRYPAPNAPAAVVQYPYYTVKGPDDFFMK